MPELPEVEVMCRAVAAVIGSRVLRIVRPRSRLQPIKILPNPALLNRSLKGGCILGVERLGKRVVFHVEPELYLVIEPRMTGRLMLTKPEDMLHLRLIIEVDHPGYPRLYFWDSRGLGVVSLLDKAELQRRLGPETLGPDALQASLAELRARLGRTARPIKVALMDQRLIAGIGNLYASEILFRARIHPENPAKSLTPSQWRALHRAIRTVLTEAIASLGSTLADATYLAPDGGSGQFQNQHKVYQQAGKPCSRCKKQEIIRRVQAQRSTFFCPNCQQLPK